MEEEGDPHLDLAVVLRHGLEDLVAEFVDGTEFRELGLAPALVQHLLVVGVVSVDLSEEFADQLDHPYFLEEFLSLEDRAVPHDSGVLAVVDEGDEFFKGVGDLAEEPEVHVLTEEPSVLHFDEVCEFAE